ncbi:MAG TPA: plastocyanin/azurin family copper-binding protein [Anaerolineaceae bacterium]
MSEELKNTPSSPLSRRDVLRLLGLGLLAAPAAGLAGCTTARENRQYVIKIQVGDRQSTFSPAEISVPRGSTITWQNIATYPQTVTCDPSKAGKFPDVSLPAGAQPFDSGELYPGQTWSYTFNVPGSYLYFSRYTPIPSVVGTVRVEA